MFLSSYAPLFALMAYLNRHVRGAGLILAIVAAMALLGLFVVMISKRRERGPRLVVQHARPQDGDVLAYVTGYLVPFFELDLSKRDDVVVLCTFIFVLMLVYINSNMLLVNPVLSLAGYHSFEVEDSDGNAYALLARRTDVEPGTVLHPAQITRYLRVEVYPDRTNDSH